LVTGERIQGNPPVLDDKELASYSTGLFNEEGYSYCKRRTGHNAGGPSRTVAITMCDEDALEPMANWWGLQTRSRGGKKITCKEGPAFRIEASGFRAELIVNEMMKYGLSEAKINQWREAVRGCRNMKSSPRKHPPHPTLIPQKESLLVGDVLACYSTGLFNGGGSSIVINSGNYRYPKIQIAVCDRDALEPVGKWWNAVVRPKGGSAKVCARGPAYVIAVSGTRAVKIIKEMIRYGLSAKKTQRWRKVLSRCERPDRTVPR
jgi:hypothetical protein